MYNSPTRLALTVCRKGHAPTAGDVSPHSKKHSVGVKGSWLGYRSRGYAGRFYVIVLEPRARGEEEMHQRRRARHAERVEKERTDEEGGGGITRNLLLSGEHIAHCTSHFTLHCTLHTTHYTQHTAHSTPDTLHTMHTRHILHLHF